jgi:Catalase/Catalase-related immune-responsive
MPTPSESARQSKKVPSPSSARSAAKGAVSQAKNEQLEAYRSHPEGATLTTDQGIRIPNTDDSLRAGLRGPSLIEDFHLREKITRFDHERIPERVVHARGSAAHGHFEVYRSLAEYTKAGFLQDPAVQTPVFARFSTVVGSRGSADTVRDVRGFAVKFYTQEQQHLAGALRFELAKVVREEIRERVVNEVLANIDLELARAVAPAVGVLKVAARPARGDQGKRDPGVETSPALSQLSSPGQTVKGRSVAILVAPGFATDQAAVIDNALKAQGIARTSFRAPSGPCRAPLAGQWSPRRRSPPSAPCSSMLSTCPGERRASLRFARELPRSSSCVRRTGTTSRSPPLRRAQSQGARPRLLGPSLDTDTTRPGREDHPRRDAWGKSRRIPGGHGA